MHGDEHFSQEQKHEAAVGLLADVIFMSRADAFVGLCMSQLARLVVAIGDSRVRIAMGSENIHLRDRWKFGEDEGWIPPAGAGASPARARPGRVAQGSSI